MQLDLRRQDLQDVSRLWRELDEVRLESPERRISHLLEGLCALIGAEDACWVSAVRRPTGGWRGWLVTGVQYLYPNEARSLIAEQGAAQIARGQPDVVTRVWATGMGRSRAIRRDDIVPKRIWLRDPYLEASSRAMRIEDRLQAGCATSPTSEATLLVDRREKGAPFSPRERDRLHLFVSGFEREAASILEAATPRSTILVLDSPGAPPLLRGLGSMLEAPDRALRWRVVDLILRSRADESFQIADLAGGLGMSRSSVERFIRAEWGISPGLLIRRLRLDMAAEMLATSSGSVASIALGAGYGGAAQFTRAFRAYFGISPSAWRRRATAG